MFKVTTELIPALVMLVDMVKHCGGHSVSHQRRDPEVIEGRHLLLKNWYFASEEEKCERTWKTGKWQN